MSSGETTTTVVVMGVSGSGKTTIAKAVVERTGWDFGEGDDFHPEANVAKMRAGIPLTDEDRWPWLDAIAAWIGRHEAAGTSAVVTCSALRRPYRDLLRKGHPSVMFAHVTAPPAMINRRVHERKGHYMAPSLLESQLATLEDLEPDEPGATIVTEGSPDHVVGQVLAALGIAEPTP